MRMNLLLLLFTLQGFNLLHAQSNPDQHLPRFRPVKKSSRFIPCVIRTAHPRWNH